MGRWRSAEERAVRQMSVAEAAYVAGIVDGEGTLSLSLAGSTAGRPHRYLARFQIANTDRVLLERLNGIIGGGRFDGKNRREGVKACYALTFTPVQIRWIVPQLLPYLVAKRRQAVALLRYLELVDSGSRGAPAEALAEVEAIYQELKRLNHRGLGASEEPFWSELDTGSAGVVPTSVYRSLCEHCGEPLAALMPHKRFCSAKCQAAHYHREVRGPQAKAALVHEQICQGCGTTFTTGYASRKFCGRPCYLRHRRAEQAGKRQAVRDCPVCGTSFPWEGGKKTYCSQRCVAAAYRRRLKE